MKSNFIASFIKIGFLVACVHTIHPPAYAMDRVSIGKKGEAFFELNDRFPAPFQVSNGARTEKWNSIRERVEKETRAGNPNFLSHHCRGALYSALIESMTAYPELKALLLATADLPLFCTEPGPAYWVRSGQKVMNDVEMLAVVLGEVREDKVAMRAASWAAVVAPIQITDATQKALKTIGRWDYFQYLLTKIPGFKDAQTFEDFQASRKAKPQKQLRINAAYSCELLDCIAGEDFYACVAHALPKKIEGLQKIEDVRIVKSLKKGEYIRVDFSSQDDVQEIAKLIPEECGKFDITGNGIKISRDECAPFFTNFLDLRDVDHLFDFSVGYY